MNARNKKRKAGRVPAFASTIARAKAEAQSRDKTGNKRRRKK